MGFAQQNEPHNEFQRQAQLYEREQDELLDLHEVKLSCNELDDLMTGEINTESVVLCFL